MTTKIIPIRRVSSLLIPTNNTSIFSYRKLRGQQGGRRELPFLLNCACWLTIAVRLHSNAWKCRSIPFVCWCINPETITRSFRKLCGDFYKVGRKPKSIFYSQEKGLRNRIPSFSATNNQTYRWEGLDFPSQSNLPTRGLGFPSDFPHPPYLSSTWCCILYFRLVGPTARWPWLAKRHENDDDTHIKNPCQPYEVLCKTYKGRWLIKIRGASGLGLRFGGSATTPS